jgi:high-affinity iron transporter
MIQAFVITLREGLEAFLIVAVSLAYLRRTDRHTLVPAALWGIVTGLCLSIIAGVLLHRAANQELLEGPLALVASVSVGWLVVQMWRSGRHMGAEIKARLQDSATRPGFAAMSGVFLFILFMVTREGMETALLLIQLRDVPSIFMGAMWGILGAASLAWAWVRYGRRINLSLLFQATAIFLLVFVFQLTIQGVHESAEQHLLPFSDIIHTKTESWGPDSPFGHLLTYLLVVLPAAWCFIAWFTTRYRYAPAATGLRSEPMQWSAAIKEEKAASVIRH